jgi:hypothetical protein
MPLHRRVRAITGRDGLLAACACAALLAWHAPAALGLSQRGHSFLGTITSPAEDKALNEPRAVAVSEDGTSAGDVYVLDRGNNRVVRFGPTGEFISAWGWGVTDGLKQYETCTQECREAISGTHRYQLSRASTAISVDNSTSPTDPSRGDVYVDAETATGSHVIDKFGPAGEPIEQITAVKTKFEGVVSTEPLEETPAGFTIAPDGTLWLYEESKVVGFANTNTRKAATTILEPLFEGEPAPGLALDGVGDFYLGHTGFSNREGTPDVLSKQNEIKNELGETALQTTIEEISPEDTSGSAVDQATKDVYLDNKTHLTELTDSGVVVQRLGEDMSREEPLKEGAGIAIVNSTSATDAAHAGFIYVADSAANDIAVYQPEPPGAPTIDGISSQDLTSQAVQLNGQIDPRGGATSYYFQYGTSDCKNEPAACTNVPSSPTTLSEGFAGYADQPATAELNTTNAPLSPATTYHYRLIAANAHGTIESPEATFTTPPTGGESRADQRGWELVSAADKNGGSVEPLTEGGGEIQAATSGTALAYITTAPIGEPQGNRSLEPTQILATRGTTGWSSQDIVTPNDQGTGLILGENEFPAFSESLALAIVQPFPGGGPLAEPPLTPPQSEGERGNQEKTIYLRANTPVPPENSEQEAYRAARKNGETMQNPGFLALVDAANTPPGTHYGQQLEFLDATPDLAHVVFKSKIALTPESAAGPNLYEWSATDNGKLTLVNRLPNGSAQAGAQLGEGGSLLRNAISTDGTRIIWNAENHLFVRDLASGETLRVDGSSNEQGAAVYQTASADDSKIFFTDEQRLTEGAGAQANKPDLYVCELGSTEGHLSCNLHDLTSPHSGEVADVRGLALGASEDGTTIYFVADGTLGSTPNKRGEQAQPGRCRPEPQPGDSCNLYSEHRGNSGWEPPLFIAQLSSEDSPDWEPAELRGNAIDLGRITARVSPKGRYIAFMSDQSLTGYDNRDANPAAQGARDEEVYLYDASSGTLICASCNPGGSRPRGVFDPTASEPANEEGWGLVVDRPKTWAGRWLAGSIPGWTKANRFHALHQARYLSDSGRLYFTSPADLTPEATNHKNDVYEYEPFGVPHGPHSCSSSSSTFTPSLNGCLGLVSSGAAAHESALLDASESGGENESSHTPEAEGGGDVFFTTAANLTPQDTDTAFDVYDAHECTIASPCLTPPTQQPPTPCEETATCRPYNPATPSLGTPATLPRPEQSVLPTTTLVKPKPPSRFQRLAAALKLCRSRHKHSRAARKACERQARKRYGPVRRARATQHRHHRGRR